MLNFVLQYCPHRAVGSGPYGAVCKDRRRGPTGLLKRAAPKRDPVSKEGCPLESYRGTCDLRRPNWDGNICNDFGPRTVEGPPSAPFVAISIGDSHMTSDDFLMFLSAFVGFVLVPAVILWSFERFVHRKQSGRRGSDTYPSDDSTDALSGDASKESARSGKANEFLRRLDSARANCVPATAV